MDSDLSDIDSKEAIGLLEHVCFIGDIGLHRCHFPKCHTFFVIPAQSTQFEIVVLRNNKKVPGEGFEMCDRCGSDWCIQHSRTGTKQEDSTFWCNDCSRTYVRI